jgi:hypothetical protein
MSHTARAKGATGVVIAGVSEREEIVLAALDQGGSIRELSEEYQVF